MARIIRSLPLHVHNMHNLSFLPASVNFLIIFIAILSIFSIVTFLCGNSHKFRKSGKDKEGKRTVRLGDKKPVTRFHSCVSIKALNIAKMISWRKEQQGDEEEAKVEEVCDDDQAVWKRTIMKGEKCRALDFSGQILYDSNGNLLPHSAH